MNSHRQQLEVLRRQVTSQVNALAAIKEVFAQEAEHLHRHDQAKCLEALGAEVAQQVRAIQRMEATSAWGFTQGTLISAAIKFAVGSLIAALAQTPGHPLSIGGRLAESELARTAPFGAVVVAVGSGGIPNDVRVIPLSRLAREQDRSESEVMAALWASGYRLMPPEVFSVVLDELKEKVLKGILALPVAASSLVQKPADGSPE